ncbi:MAG: MerR family transcriptional regulator [Actinobacteria bacterium]|nr:MerR family transcriptional regulator [Actinomycetota bacterium]
MALEEKKYGIGEVQNVLREEFPDITISKIRFLEKEGLITPERTESGYRKFNKTHIRMLSYVLRLQREEYLPLSVIKKKMEDLESGKTVAGDMTVMSGKEEQPLAEGSVPLTVELAPAKLGLSPETVKELVDYGIVNVNSGPDGKYFAKDDVKVLAIAKEFFRYGIEARHLRMFKQFVNREASLIEQIVRPQLQHRDPSSKRNAIKHLENLISVSQMFIEALLQKELSEHLPKEISVELSQEDSAQAGVVEVDGTLNLIERPEESVEVEVEIEIEEASEQDEGPDERSENDDSEPFDG